MGQLRDHNERSFFTDWTRADAVDEQRAVRERRWWPGRSARWGAGLVLAGAVVAGLGLAGSTAVADPSPHTWYRLRVCESGNRYAINTGNGHYGAYQFDLPTWRSVGGHGYPYRAPKQVQDARALMLYRLRGWQPWQCAAILRLRPDRDAASGRLTGINIGRTSRPTARATTSRHRVRHTPRPAPAASVPAAPTSIPAFPGGANWYYYGQTNSNIKRFQDEMHRRGYFPVGTGQFGPNTLRMVKRLQQLNGLVPNGYLGPNTWRLAWTGRYAAPGAHIAATPAFPGGSHWYHYGETNRNIKRFQDEMHRRGYFPVGTGQYGPNTLHMVKRLQQQNGLVPNGFIGPNTWRLAWIGRY